MTEGDRIRNRKKQRRRKISRCFIRVSNKYGAEMATAYLSTSNIKSDVHPSIRMETIKLDTFEKLHSFRPSRKLMLRIELMNKICGLTLLNMGWNCQGCKLRHGSIFFFEIDHIIPSSESGSNKPDNLQLLCPNCHKIKTQELNGITRRHSFRKNNFVGNSPEDG
jgi:5-methylcytosine-specific restriction endonuclease McrA